MAYVLELAWFGWKEPEAQELKFWRPA